MKMLALTTSVATLVISRLGRTRLGLLAAAGACAFLVLSFGIVAEEVMEGDTHKLDMTLLMMFRTPSNEQTCWGRLGLKRSGGT